MPLVFTVVSNVRVLHGKEEREQSVQQIQSVNVKILQNQKLNMDTGIATRMKKENGFVISSVTKKRMVLYHR